LACTHIKKVVTYHVHSKSDSQLSELEKVVAERDDAVRQLVEDASAFTRKVQKLSMTLAE